MSASSKGLPCGWHQPQVRLSPCGLGMAVAQLPTGSAPSQPVCYVTACTAFTGMVGALVAFYGRNLALDERIAAQRREARRQRRLALNAQGLAGAGLGAGAGVAGVGMGAAAGEQAKAAKSFGNKVQEVRRPRGGHWRCGLIAYRLPAHLVRHIRPAASFPRRTPEPSPLLPMPLSMVLLC